MDVPSLVGFRPCLRGNLSVEAQESGPSDCVSLTELLLLSGFVQVLVYCLLNSDDCLSELSFQDCQCSAHRAPGLRMEYLVSVSSFSGKVL